MAIAALDRLMKELRLPFQGDGWHVRMTADQAASVDTGHAEAVFTVGNGFIGARGRLEEDDPSVAAVYLNGVYERLPIHYHEKAHGFATASDTRLPAPSGLYLALEIDGQCIGDTRHGAWQQNERSLDLRAGLLRREGIWRTADGRRFGYASERLASFDEPGLMALAVSLTPLDADAALLCRSRLALPIAASQDDADAPHDPRVGPAIDGRIMTRLSDIVVENQGIDGLIAGFVLRAPQSGHAVASAMAHRIEGGEQITPFAIEQLDDTGASCAARLHLRRGKTVRLVKWIAYAASRTDDAEPLAARASHCLNRAMGQDFDRLKAQQAQYLNAFWAHADVKLEGDDAAQQALRFNMLQLTQAGGRDGTTSIGAKGQSGEGYEGHYFWDAEIFALPYFAFTQPATARAMLCYRHGCLDGARAHARAMGHAKGALYPWRTIGGDECSAYFPAGSAQYHINADIAYALRQYVEVTGDEDFLFSVGAEMLFETARLWLEVGYHNPRRDNRFCIDAVTGPDEYTALINNNFYTNAMAAAHLDFACATADRMRERVPQAWKTLADHLLLEPTELAAWRRAADTMLLPHDDALGIPAQDDSFLHKQKWDFAGTPAHHYPLLLHYHPLTLYRRQVCKQADTVLAMTLLPGLVAPEAAAKAFDYYEAVTVHDSTLSPGAFSVAASLVGQPQKAYEYFRATVFTDLADLHGNSSHGLHMAALAASWMAVSFGFGGMRCLGGQLSFAPYLPPGLTGYAFRLCFQGRRLAVDVNADGVTYRLLSGAPLEISHHRRPLRLDAEAITCPH
ncbi:MAG: glycosyl hydrolase family 65 protein [Sphingomonadales bacterium]